ncbi:MAG: DNA endonuclease SmrA [Alteromonadaceae bacterium]|nr:MAG: DNA endonuclease SmrA [Alteromonadaceae bacterium]
MSDDDFIKSMLGDDVEPLNVDKRVSLSTDKEPRVDKNPRRVAATAAPSVEMDPLSTLPQEMVDPLAILYFQRPGVQHGVFKNLRLGKYQLDARLDLHRMTVEQARVAVYQFVSDCVEHDVRCALVTHGKGLGREKPALLKSCVAHWLPELEAVLAFHSAQKYHGGSGATYILVRKSDKRKLENKEENRKNSR